MNKTGIAKLCLAGGVLVTASEVSPATGVLRAQATGAYYYVSPSGDDASTDGSLSHPYRTIQRCANQAQAGDTCIIRGGTYHETVTPPRSGTSTAPIFFYPYSSSEPVTIDGADPLAGWTQTTTTTIDPSLGSSEFYAATQAGHVWQADVQLAGQPTGLSYPQPPPPGSLFAQQIFVDGAMMPEARYPHSGLDPLYTARLSAGNSTYTPHPGDPSGYPGLTVIDTHVPNGAGGTTAGLPQPSEFWNGGTATRGDKQAAYVNVVSGSGVFADTAPVVASDYGLQNLAVNSPYSNNALYSAMCSNNIGCIQKADQYYLFGKLGALGRPGEWFYDDQEGSGRLYLYTPDGASPSTHSIEAKRRNYAFDLAGRSYVGVLNVRIFGATVRTDASSQGDLLDGLTATYVSHFMQVPTYFSTLPWGDYDLAQFQLTTGIILAGSNNVLRNSVITYSAGTGVAVTGSGNTVTNNAISEVDYSGVLTGGVFIGGSYDPSTGKGMTTSNQNVSNNTIFDTGAAGVMEINAFDSGGTAGSRLPAYSNINISYNDIFNTGVITNDGGAIYVCCNHPTGTAVAYNWVHEHEAKTLRYGVASGYTGAGIYFDIAADGATIHHNVSWNTAGSGIRLNGISGGPQEQKNDLLYNNTLGYGQHSSVATYFSTDATDEMAGSSIFNNFFATDYYTAGANYPGSESNLNQSSGAVKMNDYWTDQPSTPRTEPPLSRGPNDPALTLSLNGANFVNPFFGDYHLTATSQAIDFGTPNGGATDDGAAISPDAGAYEQGSDWTPGCSLPVPACRVYLIDDSPQGAGHGAAFSYAGAGWSHCSPWLSACQAVLPYGYSLSSDTTAGDNATLTFTGTAVVLHTQTGPANGIASLSIDGGPSVLIDTWEPTPGGDPSTGDQVVWRSPQLSNAAHTLTITVTGSRNASSSGTAIGVDRADVVAA